MTDIFFTIQQALIERLNHQKINVTDDSMRHKGHGPYEQNHAYIIIRISQFHSTLSRLDLHRKIMQIAKDASIVPIHAINIYFD